MNKSELLEILNNLDCEEISLSQLKTLYITNNKNYNNFYVYVFYKNLEVMYVGQTTNLRKRFINHFRKNEYEDWKSEITKVEVFELESYSEMMGLESKLIDTLKPTYNRKEQLPRLQLKDEYDSYFLSKEELFQMIEPMEIKYSDILLELEKFVELSIDKIVIVDWIRENFYDEDTKQQTINTCYDNIKSDILNLCSKYNYTLISKRGKGNKAYIQKQ